VIFAQGDAKRFFLFLIKIRQGVHSSSSGVVETLEKERVSVLGKKAFFISLDIVQILKYPVHTVTLIPKTCSAVVLAAHMFRAITLDAGHHLTTIQLVTYLNLLKEDKCSLKASQAFYVFAFEDLSQVDMIS